MVWRVSCVVLAWWVVAGGGDVVGVVNIDCGCVVC